MHDERWLTWLSDPDAETLLAIWFAAVLVATVTGIATLMFVATMAGVI